jgi:ABC-type transport system involved in cytochrome c biogenesis permease subunit
MSRRVGLFLLRYMPIAAMLFPVFVFSNITFVHGRQDGLAGIFDGEFCRFTDLWLYLPALLAGLVAMLLNEGWGRRIETLALFLVSVGLAFHGMVVISEALVHGRPPVTDLRSVLLFAGWVAAYAGQRVELRRRDGPAGFAAALAGFVTVYIASRMAVAAPGAINPVIDVRHWLILHVVIISCGYGAVLLAVLLANVRLIGGLFGMDEQRLRSVSALAHRTISAGLFLTTLGTLMGGLWAMKAWGRFWGWDPKENAALMLILWCALALHARRVALVREAGFARLAAAAGLVLAWSWAGTNMLGSGLHSYGFAAGGFVLLGAYVLAQLTLVAASFIPRTGKSKTVSESGSRL